MEKLTEKLLNNYQRDFPLIPNPFSQLALALNTSTENVLERLKVLQASGAVSRVGPVFRPNTVGASTLATMAVPADKLADIAAIINEFPQVNHNYEREHRYNLWFVVTASNTDTLDETLRQIQIETGYKALILPLVKDYHIDLGFPMNLGGYKDLEKQSLKKPVSSILKGCNSLSGSAEDLIELIQDGLPLVTRPYRDIAERLGCTEQAVIDSLHGMINAGIVKRLGVVVRHHELGYRANAMVVWDVSNDRVDRLGQQLGRQDCVTLCYQRPRCLPDWPYNLFCMVHGRDRKEVLNCIDEMTEGLGLEDIAQSVLFSRQCFKQRGARYRLKH